MALIVLARISYKVYKPKVIAIMKPEKAPPSGPASEFPRPDSDNQNIAPVRVSDWLDPNSPIH